MRMGEKQREALRRNMLGEIAAGCTRNRMTYKELAERLQMSSATLWRKRMFPETFTLGELIAVANAINVSLPRLIGSTEGE